MNKIAEKNKQIQYTVLTVRDGILRVSLNPQTLSRNENKKAAVSSKNRVVVQGEFLEVFSNDTTKSTDKYLAKVFSIKEDVIEAVLLADDRPVKERFLARLTGTTGRVKVGFDLLGRTVDALGQFLDAFSEPDSKKILEKKRLRKFFAITEFYANVFSKNKKKKIKSSFICVNGMVRHTKYIPFDFADLYGQIFESLFINHIVSYLSSGLPKSKLIHLINSAVSAKRLFHYNSIFVARVQMFETVNSYYVNFSNELSYSAYRELFSSVSPSDLNLIELKKELDSQFSNTVDFSNVFRESFLSLLNQLEFNDKVWSIVEEVIGLYNFVEMSPFKHHMFSDIRDLLSTSKLNFEDSLNELFSYLTVSYKRFIKATKPSFVFNDLERSLSQLLISADASPKSRNTLLSNITYFAIKHGADAFCTAQLMASAYLVSYYLIERPAPGIISRQSVPKHYQQNVAL